jgi:hypothetical protein
MWGMTELSPLGSVNTLKGAQVDMELTPEEQLNVKVRSYDILIIQFCKVAGKLVKN